MEDNNIAMNNNIGNKKENKKYEIKFSVIIKELRKKSDNKEEYYSTEFTTNLLLMSPQINTTNKISCLTLLSYINYERNNSKYTYYINKKIFKYLKIQKSIESFIYIRTLYRASYFLKNENNYFYAKKFVNEAENLCQNSKIDIVSINLLNNVKDETEKGINEYFNLSIKKFKELENIEEKYSKLIKLFNELNDNTYKKNNLNSINNINNNNDDLYLYLVNKTWFNKAFNFLLDYNRVRKQNHNLNYFSIAFNPNYCYQKYFDINDKLQKNNYNYNPFPCNIDNFSIINWKDNWYDPVNDDENYILKQNLKEGKDYLLLEKNDFEFLQNLFGVTNIIKRKKNCTDFIEAKVLIIEDKLREKENMYFLRKRSLQIRKNYKIKDLKEKLIRCIQYNIQKEKIIKEDIQNKKEETDEIMVNMDKELNKYNLYFYLLEKDKKDVLMEICISLSKKLPKYESIFLHNIPLISEDNFILKVLSNYDLTKYILIIELQKTNSNKFMNQIIPLNSSYYCTVCKKEIKSIEKRYKCNICNYSLFCSEECAKKDMNHSELDKIYLSQYLYEKFDLVSFLKINIFDLPMIKPESSKGIVGLTNLGNTCYINSTLQCLSNSYDLTKYFLMEYFKNDINTGNKLGSNGTIAMKYYNLINRMWCGTENKIIPNIFIDTFKNVKKQFEGYKQQDAQEFLSVLLEQLHEDLNRITDKPYVELLEKQDNEDDLVASKRWWDLHKKREDSIIIDLFNGQLKSETICQVCRKSSIIYDPFMSLCVPLPKEKKLLSFKIFYDIECYNFDFQYEEYSTISELKRKAMEFIVSKKKDSSSDLETVILDSHKNIMRIMSTDVSDKNYNGDTKIKYFLINNEIVFFKKIINTKERNDYINIYIYLIEHQKPDKNSFSYAYYNDNNPIQLEYITYPLFFQLNKDITIRDLYSKVLNRIQSTNFIIENKYVFFDRREHQKILDLNIIHGKETKNEGFFYYFFSWEDTCKYCGQSNNKTYYCSILNYGKLNQTIGQVFENIKKPIVLMATSDCYNLSGDKNIYSNCPLDKNKSKKIDLDKSTSDKISLKKCLDLFISNENFQEDDSWFCSKCKKLQKSKQKLKIYKPPNYLIILLKRYNLKNNYGNIFYGEKNNIFVSYPINNFDIREYIVGPEKDKAIYDLYGVIEHYGTMNQGHYTAICKNNGNWISYNDSNVGPAENPITKNAYVLFYKMKKNEN